MSTSVGIKHGYMAITLISHHHNKGIKENDRAKTYTTIDDKHGVNFYLACSLMSLLAWLARSITCWIFAISCGVKPDRSIFSAMPLLPVSSLSSIWAAGEGRYADILLKTDKLLKHRYTVLTISWPVSSVTGAYTSGQHEGCYIQEITNTEAVWITDIKLHKQVSKYKDDWGEFRITKPVHDLVQEHPAT